jgi:hypothetical protein
VKGGEVWHAAKADTLVGCVAVHVGQIPMRKDEGKRGRLRRRRERGGGTRGRKCI